VFEIDARGPGDIEGRGALGIGGAGHTSPRTCGAEAGPARGLVAEAIAITAAVIPGHAPVLRGRTAAHVVCPAPPVLAATGAALAFVLTALPDMETGEVSRPGLHDPERRGDHGEGTAGQASHHPPPQQECPGLRDRIEALGIQGRVLLMSRKHLSGGGQTSQRCRVSSINRRST
jgi:hypothetical protein